jgi:hypothetical protein
MKKLFIIIPIIVGIFIGILHFRYPQFTIFEAGEYVVHRTLYFAKLKLNKYGKKESARIEIENVRRMILDRYPDIVGLPPLQKSLALRDILHGFLGNKSVGLDFTDFDLLFDLAFNGQKHICGGLSYLYTIALKSFGIESRFIGLYAETENASFPVESHASVEVLIDGKWIALDPTYAFSIFYESKRIGWREARGIMLSGGEVEYRHDGVEPKIPVTDFSRVVQNIITPGETLPREWDGVIRYANGRTEDVTRFGGVYERISDQ